MDFSHEAALEAYIFETTGKGNLNNTLFSSPHITDMLLENTGSNCIKSLSSNNCIGGSIRFYKVYSNEN